jgi:hypothetical protein
MVCGTRPVLSPWIGFMSSGKDRRQFRLKPVTKISAILYHYTLVRLRLADGF